MYVWLHNCGSEVCCAGNGYAAVKVNIKEYSKLNANTLTYTIVE